jgi:hypothetical protein
MLDAQVVVQLDLVFGSESAKQAVELLIGVALVVLRMNLLLNLISESCKFLSTLTSSSEDLQENGQSWQ